MSGQRRDIPWEKLYDYVLACGREHDPFRFVVCALEGMGSLVPYDQGLAYCLDEKRAVCAQHLVNIKSRWSTMYLEYYSKLVTTSHTLDDSAEETFDAPFVTRIDWTQEPVTEFIANYIMARGVKRSLTFALFDLNSLPRAAFSLDRTRETGFSETEVEIARLAVAQLGSLYKNFFTNPSAVPGSEHPRAETALESVLTKREREVVELMCQGLSPAHVAKTLRINVSTAYKHIAHIYRKLGVSSQQELLVRILGTGGSRTHF